MNQNYTIKIIDELISQNDNNKKNAILLNVYE